MQKSNQVNVALPELYKYRNINIYCTPVESHFDYSEWLRIVGQIIVKNENYYLNIRQYKKYVQRGGKVNWIPSKSGICLKIEFIEVFEKLINDISTRYKLELKENEILKNQYDLKENENKKV